jgi:hypothetical protein
MEKKWRYKNAFKGMEKEVQCNNIRKEFEKEIPPMVSSNNISYEMQKRETQKKTLISKIENLYFL